MPVTSFHGSYSSLQLCCDDPRLKRTHRKVDVTREYTGRILKLREMPLSSQTGFGLVKAAVVCVVLESISALEPSSDTTEPRYLKLVTFNVTTIKIYGPEERFFTS